MLEQLYPDRLPLVPAEGSPERPRYESLMRLERRLFSDWLSWLCNSWWVGRRRGKGQNQHTVDVDGVDGVGGECGAVRCNVMGWRWGCMYAFGL